MREDEEIKGENFLEASFAENSFTRSTFIGCRFSNCNFQGAQFVECTFKNCHLDFPFFDQTRLQHTLFEACKVIGAKFHLCSKQFFSPSFVDSLLMACNFSELKTKKMNFRHSQIKECFFNHAELIEADFSHADLEGSLFHHCDLSKSNFRQAIHYSINPQTNVLKKALFSAPEVQSLLDFFEINIE